MSAKKSPRLWADPNREGRLKDKQNRSCSRCGNTVQRARILKSANLCEFCVKELSAKRDGITSCRGCGKVAPLEVKEHQGYCNACICPACGRPDPEYLPKAGLCRHCATQMGDFCRRCGKEAPAQVHKNKGFCDECAVLKPTAPRVKARLRGPSPGRPRR